MQNFEHNRGSANVKFDPNDEKKRGYQRWNFILKS